MKVKCTGDRIGPTDDYYPWHLETPDDNGGIWAYNGDKVEAETRCCLRPYDLFVYREQVRRPKE